MGGEEAVRRGERGKLLYVHSCLASRAGSYEACSVVALRTSRMRRAELMIASSRNRDLKSRAPNSIIAAQLDELIRSMESAGM